MADEPNTIDDLMDRDPLSLTTDDIAAIIAYHRKARASATGERKPKREAGVKIDIYEVFGELMKPAAAAPVIRRR